MMTQKAGETINLVDLSSDFACIMLLPFMAYPSNEVDRERYASTLMAKLYEGVGADLPNHILPNLIQASERGVTDFTKSVHGGCMAGDVFLARLEMTMAGTENPGIDRAQHVVSEHYKEWVDGSGKAFKAGRDTVRNHWKRYANAAHLWAAYLILTREAEAAGLRRDPSAWLDGIKLASIATGLQALAARIHRADQGAPILPPTAFQIIGVDPATVTPPELMPGFVEALATFEPRYRP